VAVGLTGWTIAQTARPIGERLISDGAES
jgi:hypothetical protein